MDLETFHVKLLGKNPPKSFKVADSHKVLYKAFDEGKRGFSAASLDRKDFDQFVATFVAAFYLTAFPTPGKVCFAVARPVEKWAVEQIKTIVKYIYTIRKGVPQEAIEAIDSALKRMEIGSRVIQIEEEPERWVSFGFNQQDILPPWMRGRLVRHT